LGSDVLPLQVHGVDQLSYLIVHRAAVMHCELPPDKLPVTLLLISYGWALTEYSAPQTVWAPSSRGLVLSKLRMPWGLSTARATAGHDADGVEEALHDKRLCFFQGKKGIPCSNDELYERSAGRL
jgi:hypothetical protein